MLMALKLEFSHRSCKANLTTDVGLVPVGVSFLRALVGTTQPQARLCVARGPATIAVPSGLAVTDAGQKQGQGASHWGSSS